VVTCNWQLVTGTRSVEGRMSVSQRGEVSLTVIVLGVGTGVLRIGEAAVRWVILLVHSMEACKVLECSQNSYLNL
jgi:hypothetical protein